MSDMIARGMAAQAMPYNPAFLSQLGRPPRVLIIGESILDDNQIQTELQTLVPGAVVDRRTYDGSQTVMGMLLASTDVQAQVTPGNQLPNSNIANWLASNVTQSVVISPTTGKQVVQVTANGVSQQNVNTTAVVPTGAPNLCLSIDVEPGTLQSFRVVIQNQNSSPVNGIVVQNDFYSTNDITDRALLPVRFYIPITSTTGVGYAAGNTLTITIYPGADSSWAAGTMYFSRPMLNVGSLPAPYTVTSGTAQAVGTQVWTQMNSGTDRRLFDLAIVQFGRNDADAVLSQFNFVSSSDHEKMLSSIVSGIGQFAARVMIVTPPPMANSSTPTAWASSDPYQANGHHVVALRVAYKHGCFLYDAWSDFQKQVTNGKYTVSQIMRDQYHPTNGQLQSSANYGIMLFVSAFASVLNGIKDSPIRPLGSTPMTRIGGTPSGSFAWTYLNSGVTTYDPTGMLIGWRMHYYTGAYQSTTANDSLQFTVTGSIIGLIIVNDQNTIGQMTVSVDGVQVGTINTNHNTQTMYPLGYVVATGLPNVQHTVTVQTVSGTVYVIACVAC